MSDAQKLAALLLHLELQPEELKKYQADRGYARRELKHFGLSDQAIKVVLDGNLCEFGEMFDTVRTHVGFGVVGPKASRRKK